MRKTIMLIVILAMSSFAHAQLPPGNGAWLQPNSINNQYIDSFDWFIVDANDMETIQTDKPIIMAYSGRYSNELEKKTSQYQNQIAGVIIDYEFLWMTQKEAEKDIKAMWEVVKSYNLTMGVVVLPGPWTSRQLYGVSYQRAYLFCDYLMPMLYHQWWVNGEETIADRWEKEKNVTSVPLYPITAIQTIKPQITITSEDLRNTLGILQPRPDSMVFWNIRKLNRSMMEVIINR
jgi:hypothetical protein